ncbi:MAG: pirin family protein [Paludibacterium sp.]|uniref:pirin family protein n=1 Tax=Paludibacterium sp. TaxID=1917523 RepID=UPI0025D6E854|nr:pirin family protein [Paludibacterium sp.]MBV8049249.1 pirin family protein [Paludibacterium sp.]MBV8648263.1 pirin family protein [Paludibacterium sp.]
MSSLILLPSPEKDLGGGFVVRRSLPAAACRAVGPFVFFDHMGPVRETPGHAHDVRPHPHIGLATVTYLFAGAMMHRDSLGSVQRIEPGAINWMTAGRGIVHSERKPEDLLDQTFDLHGLQLWCALPREAEECEPAFAHTPAAALPQIEVDGATVRVLIGEAFGARSPVATFSETVYLDLQLTPESDLALPDHVAERAVYAVDGEIELNGERVPPRTMAVLAPDCAWRLTAPADARAVLIGGAPLDGPRAMWWNFVSSRRERIEEAKADWQAQRMGAIPGETEWIPLPG